jgi:hypothetical protein
MILWHCHSERSEAKSRMERLGKPRHRREGRRLSEREVSESKSAAQPKAYSTGSLDSARDDGRNYGDTEAHSWNIR